MARSFIPMYRILNKDGGLEGYALTKPSGSHKKKAKELGLTFQHIRSEEDLTENDLKLVVALFDTVEKAAAFSEGVAICVVQKTKIFRPTMMGLYGQGYVVIVEFFDKSEKGYDILDYRNLLDGGIQLKDGE